MEPEAGDSGKASTLAALERLGKQLSRRARIGKYFGSVFVASVPLAGSTLMAEYQPSGRAVLGFVALFVALVAFILQGHFMHDRDLLVLQAAVRDLYGSTKPEGRNLDSGKSA